MTESDKVGGDPITPPATTQNNENLSILERAEKLNKEVKEAEERISAYRKVIEEIETKRILGGQSSAGSISKTAEELKKETSDIMAAEIVNAFKRR